MAMAGETKMPICGNVMGLLRVLWVVNTNIDKEFNSVFHTYICLKFFKKKMAMGGYLSKNFEANLL